jgi:hypothetical protein
LFCFVFRCSFLWDSLTVAAMCCGLDSWVPTTTTGQDSGGGGTGKKLHWDIKSS